MEDHPAAHWTFPALWESVAASLPQADAIIQGGRRLTWADFDREADALAAALLTAGMNRHSKVAVLTRNRPEYLVAYFAAFKAGLTPFNVNYRYGQEEVAYLLDNGDAEAVLFEAEYADLVAQLRETARGVRLWISVGDAPPAAGVLAYRQIVAAPVEGPVVAAWGRDEADPLMLFTGGTTGMPKGVIWRQGDLIGRTGFVSNPRLGMPSLDRPDQAGPRAAAQASRPRALVACPLMHGTGQMAAISTLNFGGCVILTSPGKFDPEALWRDVERTRASRLSLVGDPFARPLAETLEGHPGRWDLSSLRLISSSGAMWSAEIKSRLLAQLPQLSLMDSFSSSEAFGIGMSVTTADGSAGTAQFTLGPDCAVFTEDGRRVQPGSEEQGLVALGGYLPAGYYKDPAKSAQTFREIEGRRWSIPGDWACVREDGAILLLGRGSQCINTGGEKVFPEEVEEVLKRHPDVLDAAVAGIADARFGERIAALVELAPGASIDEAALQDHVRSVLAGYKVPRHILPVASIARGPNGKLDYQAVKARAVAAFGDR